MQVYKHPKMPVSMLCLTNSSHSATRTNLWSSNSPSNMNRTSIAVAVTWKCSTAHWTKRTCTAKARICLCSDQTFAALAPRKCTSSSATRAKIIWSTRKSVARTTYSPISTHWSFNQTTPTKCWSIMRKLSRAIWKMTGTFWHQRKSRIQVHRNQTTGTKEWVELNALYRVVVMLTGCFLFLANHCRSRW